MEKMNNTSLDIHTWRKSGLLGGICPHEGGAFRRVEPLVASPHIEVHPHGRKVC